MTRCRTSPTRLLALGIAAAALVPVLVTPTSSAAAGRAARQSGTTSLLPPVAQRGSEPADSSAARVAGTVRFTPARPGRPVVIEQRLGGGPWRAVGGVRHEDRDGKVLFTAKAASGGRPYAYRGVAARHRGLARVVARAASGTAWSTTLYDEFDGTALDPDLWAPRSLGSTTPHRTRSVSSEDAVAVRDGTLRLSVLPDPEDPSRFLNGHVSTEEKFSFTYGVASARVRFQRRPGQHGAFWMQPDVVRKKQGHPHSSGAEIDVAEYFGAGRTSSRLGSFVYSYGILDRAREPVRLGQVSPEANDQLPAGDDWWRSYHVFSLRWTPTSYTFLVDGRPHWKTTTGVSRVPEFLILSLLTSDYELPVLDRSALPSTMTVDWVRVWQRK